MSEQHNSDDAKRDKIIDRVRKLLAMAGDASSPNEAAIAADRARKLMDQHQLSQEDFAEKSQFGTSTAGKARQVTPMWENWIAVGVAYLNDCQVGIKYTPAGRGKTERVFEFQGEVGDAQICEYLFIYLVQAGNRLAKRHMQETGKSGRSVADTFKKGFAAALQRRLKALAEDRQEEHRSSGTSLMVIKRELVAQHFGAIKYKEQAARFNGGRDSYDAGRKAGREIGIHAGVQGTGRAKLGV